MIATILAIEGETREIFEDIDTIGKVAFYLLSLVATAVFFWGWWKRLGKYRRGRPAGRLRPPNSTGRRWQTVGTIASNSSVAKRDRSMGIAHFFMFWGFITLFLGTVILTIDEDVVRLASRQFGEEQSFFKGVFYAVYSLVLDTMGLAALIALLYMGVRRGLFRLPQLDYTRAQEPEGGYSRRQFERGDRLFIGLLGLVLVTGFLHEGFRIRASEFPDFEIWSPVGWLIAKTVSGLGFPRAGSDTIRTVIWWVHSALALAFVAYIPFSKAMHMFTDAANLVAHDPDSSRRLPAADVAAGSLGYRVLGDFTWKELLDFDACTKCGRCHVACPAQASGAPLSPRDLVLDLRQWASAQADTFSLLDSESRRQPTGPLTVDGALAGDVIGVDTLWACTTCMACVEACPVGIEQVPTIVQLRRTLVDEGNMEAGLQDALQNIAQKGNSFGKSARQRARWTKGLDFTITDARKEPVRYLWFVGDFASFDDRLQELSRTLARILHDAGIDFGILYEGERNAGNDVRRVGEEGLFEMLVEQNMEQLAAAEFDEILTTDPHTLNTLRNEYPEHGLDKPVKHYTEVLADLIESGELEVGSLNRRVTYHDPCYLARYNRVTDAPRRVLRALGCDVVEMPRNRENSFCCGAGGGRIWMDDSDLEVRPSEDRIREAALVEVDTFVVACPKDFTMYSDAVKTTDFGDQMEVVDVIELVDDARDRQPAAAGATAEES
jgi:Fe-S oxidoreductase/nitrate reductase gamma subunit